MDDKELLEQMQHRVSMQYEQQRYQEKAPPVSLPSISPTETTSFRQEGNTLPTIHRGEAVISTESTSYSNLYTFAAETGVGQGTLLTEHLDVSKNLTTSGLGSSVSSGSPLPNRQIPSYGAISYDSDLAVGPPSPANVPAVLTNSRAQTPLYPDDAESKVEDYSKRTTSLTPDFQYINPDYLTSRTESIERALEDFDPDGVEKQSSRFCGCAIVAVAQFLTWVAHSESLHRLFCASAIDGVLTGSGLLAALLGLGVVTPSSSTAVRSWVVALTGTVCLAEAICIGLGHVWNTYADASSQAWDRASARHRLSRRKADAKGSLVDVLLQRGMLKIDAMSLADTLEGYPDLFVSAMTGEPWTTPLESPAPSLVQIRNVTSYSHLSEESDPDGHAVSESLKEARGECIFITLGFCIFSLVPSLVFRAERVNSLSTGNSHQRYSTATQVSSHDGSTNPFTVVILVSSLVLWCLGLWKSRFYNEQNWLLFSFEPVLILLVCVVVSMGVGVMLGKVMPLRLDEL